MVESGFNRCGTAQRPFPADIDVDDRHRTSKFTSFSSANEHAKTNTRRRETGGSLIRNADGRRVLCHG
jgi:hypothetical protein